MQQQHVPFVKKPSGKREYPVEVRSAGHMGDGVFATRNIKRGEICCFYDGIVVSSKEAGVLVSNVHGYNQIITDDMVIAGFTKQIRPGGCAQLCNDASTDYEDDDLKYLKNINVHIWIEADGACAPLFVAKKPIKKNEQLLYNYGKDYWDARLSRETYGEIAPKGYFKLALDAYGDSELTAEMMEQYPEGNNLEDFIQRWKLQRRLGELQAKQDQVGQEKQDKPSFKEFYEAFGEKVLQDAAENSQIPSVEAIDMEKYVLHMRRVYEEDWWVKDWLEMKSLERERE